MFIRNTLKQDTQEWLDWRGFGIGASDVLTILGLSEYKTRWELWAEKLGIRKPTDLSRNPHVRRGKRLEPLVREVVERKLNMSLEVFCGHDSEHEWRRVSFDGVGKGNIPVEIKCPYTMFNSDDIEVMSESMMEKAANDKYLDLIENGKDSKLFQQYEYQLQYQIGMLGGEYGYLVFYFEHNNKLKIYRVDRNNTMIENAFASVDEFWLNHIVAANEPEKDPDRDVYLPSEKEYIQWDKETLELFDVIKQKKALKKQLKELSEEEDMLIGSIHSMASNFKRLALHGLKINVVAGRKTFNYKEYLKDKGIEISDEDKQKYTKIGKTSTRLSPFKENVMDEIKNDVVNKQRKEALSLFMDLHAESEDEYIENDEFLYY